MDEKITLQFSAAELSILDQALSAMPYRVVAPLIANINEQLKSKEASD